MNTKSALFAAGLTICSLSQASAVNFVEIISLRLDDFVTPDPFGTLIEVSLDVVATGVTVTSPDAVVHALVQQDGSAMHWDDEHSFVDLNALKTATNGAWTVQVFGTTAGTLSFSLNTSGWVDGDFFNTPTMVSPADGASGVALDTPFSWTAPAGDFTDAEVIFVDVEGSSTFQEDDLATSATSWDPPSDIEPGTNEFAVAYVEVGDSALFSSVSSIGAITWGPSDDAPGGYPSDGTPLLIMGSETIVEFDTVPEPSRAVFLLTGVVALGLRRRR